MNPLLTITGGTKGIGKAIITTFMENGFDVITCARNEQELTALQAEMKEKFPTNKLLFQVADLSIKEDVDAFGKYILQQTSYVDVLVNNTGVFIPGQVHNETEGTLEKTIETNLYSAYHLTRALVPSMMDRKSGHIFTICSTASITAYPNGGSYCISKYALLGMTKVLREEMKPHQVRVTAVLPGATLTNSWSGTDLPQERFIDPLDVSESVYSAYKLSKRAVIEEILIRPQLGDLG